MTEMHRPRQTQLSDACIPQYLRDASQHRQYSEPVARIGIVHYQLMHSVDENSLAMSGDGPEYNYGRYILTIVRSPMWPTACKFIPLPWSSALLAAALNYESGSCDLWVRPVGLQGRPSTTLLSTSTWLRGYKFVPLPCDSHLSAEAPVNESGLGISAYGPYCLRGPQESFPSPRPPGLEHMVLCSRLMMNILQPFRPIGVGLASRRIRATSAHGQVNSLHFANLALTILTVTAPSQFHFLLH